MLLSSTATISPCGTQFQFRYRFGDRSEFLFQWQAIARPKMRFTSDIEYRDRSVTVQLGLKKSGESKGFSALFAIIGGTNSGNVFSAMLTEISRQDVLQPVKWS
jgi:hypothetical protein